MSIHRGSAARRVRDVDGLRGRRRRRRLVAAVLLGLSARAPRLLGGAAPSRLSPRAGTALAVACLTATVAVVLAGLWTIVAR